MAYRAALASLVAAALLAFAPAALAAPPPTLTGEPFFAYGGPAPVPVPMSIQCTENLDGTQTIAWQVTPTGIQSGPYTGRFAERGQMRLSRDFANFEVDVLSAKADFTIDSPTGQVTGTKQLSAPANDVPGATPCDTGNGGFIVDFGPVPMTYTATVTSADGVFSDRGSVVHSFDDQGPNPAAFTELREDFTSALTATEQQHSVLFGKRTPGGSWSAMSANTKRASPFVFYFPGTVRRIHAYIDGNGATSGSQLVRAVLYRRDPQTGGPGAYVTRSFEFTVQAGMSARWVPFWLAPPATLQPGVYWLGLQSAGQHGVARYVWDSSPNARRYNVDLDSDGPSDPFGQAFSDDQQMSIFAFGSY